MSCIWIKGSPSPRHLTSNRGASKTQRQWLHGADDDFWSTDVAEYVQVERVVGSSGAKHGRSKVVWSGMKLLLWLVWTDGCALRWWLKLCTLIINETLYT